MENTADPSGRAPHPEPAENRTPAAEKLTGKADRPRLVGHVTARPRAHPGRTTEGAARVADDLPESAPPGIDPSTPTFARVYDYFLGGKDNFAADREVADMV